MKTFKHFPKDSVCPVCGNGNDKPCVLIAIAGTQEGYNVQAKPFHADCLDPLLMVYHMDEGMVVMRAPYRREP